MLLHLFIVSGEAWFLSDEEGSLRKIGEDVVCAFAEPSHLHGEIGAEAGIEFSGVGHGGVYNADGIWGGGAADDVQDGVDLGGADIACVEGIEGKAILEPACLDLRHFVGQVPQGEILEGGVDGEDGRG